MKLKNLLSALKDQLPLKRVIHNFIITRNAWGLFHINSHIAQDSGKQKIMYNTRATALKAAEAMYKKYGKVFNTYKCVYCDGYHIGKNRDRKIADKPS